MYNVEKWITKNIQSIQAQEYKNFECIIIDDLSTDKSVEIAQSLIEGDKRFRLVVNSEKKYALQNIYEGILATNPGDHDIIATVDGDDWLYDSSVLDKLNSIYHENDCYLTYGEYVKLDDLRAGFLTPNGSYPFPPSIIENNQFREYPWISSHLRSFKYGLWKKINKTDLLDGSGHFYRMAWDVAFMLPMLEMAGPRIRFVPDILYVYNNENPINDSKVNARLQLSLDREIRNKSAYSLVASLDSPSSTGKINSFKTSPLSLVTSRRFDIIAKYIFAKYRNIESSFPRDLYAHHLQVWNNCNEITNPNKSNLEDFIKFRHLFHSKNLRKHVLVFSIKRGKLRQSKRGEIGRPQPKKLRRDNRIVF